MLKLKRLRMERKWSQNELSRRSGVSQSFINDLEAGTKQPTVKTLSKLAKALGVSISELLDEDDHATSA